MEGGCAFIGGDENSLDTRVRASTRARARASTRARARVVVCMTVGVVAGGVGAASGGVVVVAVVAVVVVVAGVAQDGIYHIGNHGSCARQSIDRVC